MEDNKWDNIEWDDLLDDIANKKVVLLLGHNCLPEAHNGLRKLLVEKLGDGLQYYYHRDGLYLFKGFDEKSKAQRIASKFYRDLSVDFDLMQKIVEIPFHLMISANPDKLLVKAFAEQGIPLQFDYFTSRDKTIKYSLVSPLEAVLKL